MLRENYQSIARIRNKIDFEKFLRLACEENTLTASPKIDGCNISFKYDLKSDTWTLYSRTQKIGQLDWSDPNIGFDLFNISQVVEFFKEKNIFEALRESARAIFPDAESVWFFGEYFNIRNSRIDYDNPYGGVSCPFKRYFVCFDIRLDDNDFFISSDAFQNFWSGANFNLTIFIRHDIYADCQEVIFDKKFWHKVVKNAARNGYTFGRELANLRQTSAASSSLTMFST
jgi:hypothetical protein